MQHVRTCLAKSGLYNLYVYSNIVYSNIVYSNIVYKELGVVVPSFALQKIEQGGNALFKIVLIQQTV